MFFIPDCLTSGCMDNERHSRRAYNPDGTMIPPGTVASERRHGLTSITAFCHAPGCYRSADVSLDLFPGHGHSRHRAATEVFGVRREAHHRHGQHARVVRHLPGAAAWGLIDPGENQMPSRVTKPSVVEFQTT